MSVAAMFEEAVRVPVARRCTAIVLQLDRYRRERSGRSNLPKTAKVPQITEIGGRIGTPDLLRASRGRRGARRSGSRPRATSRRTNARDSPQRASPCQAGPEWQPGAAGQAAAATGAPCPLARLPLGCGVVARPGRRRADTARCLSLLRGRAGWGGLPTGGTARRIVGARELRRCLPRRRAFYQRA